MVASKGFKISALDVHTFTMSSPEFYKEVLSNEAVTRCSSFVVDYKAFFFSFSVAY